MQPKTEPFISISYASYKLLMEQSKRLKEILSAPSRHSGTVQSAQSTAQSASEPDANSTGNMLQGQGVLPDQVERRKEVPPPKYDIQAPADAPSIVQKSIGDPPDRALEDAPSPREGVKRRRHERLIYNESKGYPYYFLGTGPFDDE
jgi:hypothetical protein